MWDDRDSVLGHILPRRLMQLLGPWPERIFVVSSLVPKYVIKPGNFGSRSGYWLIGKHWSDTSIDPASMHWDFWNSSGLSLVLSLLVTFTRCCNGLMMCSINLDESATHVSKVARPSHLCVLFAKKLDSFLNRLANQCSMHGSWGVAIDCCWGNRNGTCYYSSMMPHRL
jgi:hypothetical protein